jgi:hypothetical protein
VRVVVVVLGLLLVTVSCTRATPPASSPAVPVFSTAPAPGAAQARTVPKTCGTVATLEDITRIFATFVDGQTLPIVGVPQDNIGRTARLDCYYGIPPGGAVAAAKVWIGLAGYVNAESARKRMTNTVADERAAGATVSDVPVGSDRGVLLKSDKWMLVATRDQLTVVVQVVAGLVRDDHAGALLGQLANFALTSR